MNKTTKEAAVKKMIKTFSGVVVSAKSKQTVIVEVGSTFRHHLYKKIVRKTRRFAVHNPSGEIAEGTRVTIQETKPISKTKRYVIVTT